MSEAQSDMGGAASRLKAAWWRFRQWRRRVNDQAVSRQVEPLDRAVTKLSLQHDGFPRTRSALRSARLTLETWPFEWVAAGLLTSMALTRLSRTLAHGVQRAAEANGWELLERAAQHFLWLWKMLKENDQSLVGLDLLMATAAAASCVLPPFVWVLTRKLARGAHYRYHLNLVCARAVILCAGAAEKPAERRAQPLKELDYLCREVEQRILRAHHTIGTMRRRSPRRLQAKHHGGLVAGALRTQLARLDVEPDKALPELAAMLLVISERYAAGRVGALLSEEALSDATPVSTTRMTLGESLRVVLTILAAMGAAVAASAAMPALQVPEDLRPWMVLGCAALAAILVAGWHRVARILEVFPGK
ncbi:hypothetical protein [Streptomyces lavendofoliae]|uniref:hypothetical protein n=1 Tax=Streptomyces lavendofoliae TaxID=67314 RepID=UPI00300E6E19